MRAEQEISVYGRKPTRTKLEQAMRDQLASSSRDPVLDLPPLHPAPVSPPQDEKPWKTMGIHHFTYMKLQREGRI